MGIEIKSDLSDVSNKFSPDGIAFAKKALANQILIDTDKYIPRSTPNALTNNDMRGNLRADVKVSDDGSKITWGASYAYYQYYRKLNFKPMKERTEKQRKFFFANKDFLLAHKGYSTQGTGPQWFETSKQANLNRWLTVFARGITYGKQ